MSRTGAKVSKDSLPKSKRQRDDEFSERPPKRAAATQKSQPVDNEPAQSEQSHDIDETISQQTPDQLAILFTQTIQKHKPDLSTIELEDQSLPATAFRTTTSFNPPRTISNLSQFLTDFTPNSHSSLSRAIPHPGRPHTLLLSFSAIRATELVRAVRAFGSAESKIAKLFAKHMKLAAMSEYVHKTRFGIGCGTPKRVEDLIRNGALSVEGLERVVLDASYRNEKRSSFFEDRDGFAQLLGLVNVEALKLRFVRGETEILVF